MKHEITEKIEPFTNFTQQEWWNLIVWGTMHPTEQQIYGTKKSRKEATGGTEGGASGDEK